MVHGLLYPVRILLLIALAVVVLPKGPGLPPADEPRIAPPPASLGLDPFYKKHLDLGGLPIVSSDKVPDEALREAHRLASIMLSQIPEVREAMIRNRTRVAIMAESEVTTDIPEHSDLNRAFPETNWNTRARGLGATAARPAVSAAEENLLQRPSDRYRGESIFIHEFAHAIMDMGIVHVDPSFTPRLKKAFEAAKATGLWKGTYAETNIHEYWAEGVQSFFDANRTADPADGVHNDIGTRGQLKAYDRGLYDMVAQYMPTTEWRWERKFDARTRQPIAWESYSGFHWAERCSAC
jgi:hypothetical protein